MKAFIAFIFFGLILACKAHSQDFGCYSTDALTQHANYLSDAYDVRGKDTINWSPWKDLNPIDITGNYYKEYNPGYPDYPKRIKMEGAVKDGKKQGEWRLYNWMLTFGDHHQAYYIYQYYEGDYVDGLKEGKWKKFEQDERNDTVLTWQATFLHDKIDGATKEGQDSITRRTIQYNNGKRNGLAISYFSDGKIASETYYKNGKKEGQEIQYWEYSTYDEKKGKGQLTTSSIANYVNDSLSGISIDFPPYTDNDIEIENYLHGKKEGECIYMKDGFISRHVEYHEDLLNGDCMDYYDSGKLATHIIYKNGLPYTVINQYSNTGAELAPGTLQNGNGTLNAYYPNGKLETEYTYKNQIPDGPFREYDDSGRLTAEGLIKCSIKKNMSDYFYNKLIRWDNSEIELHAGTIIKGYYPDNTLKSVDEYPDSNALFYDHVISYTEMGKIHEDGYLNADKISGHYILFYDNEKKEREIYFKSDSTGKNWLDGTEKYYFENGQLRALITYVMGREMGHSVFYDEDGNMMREHYIFSDSSEYNVFNKDTVNRLDKYKRKQGKWITVPIADDEQKKNNPCDIEPDEIEYYKDGKPTGTWISNPGERPYSRDSVKMVWVDSIKAYYTNYKAWDSYTGEVVREEGYILDGFFRIGTWKKFATDKKGKEYLEWEGEYVNGREDGIWKEFKKNGKIKTQVAYKEGLYAKAK